MFCLVPVLCKFWLTVKWTDWRSGILLWKTLIFYVLNPFEWFLSSVITSIDITSRHSFYLLAPAISHHHIIPHVAEVVPSWRTEIMGNNVSALSGYS